MSALTRILMLSSCLASLLTVVAADGRWTTALRHEASTGSVVSDASVDKDSLKQDLQQNSAEVVASTAGPTPASQTHTKADGSMLSESALHEATTEDLLPVSVAGADRTLAEAVKPGGSSHSDASNDDFNSESQNNDSLNIETTHAELLPLNAEAPGGPSLESPAESVESHESVDPEVDSEEVFTSPGAAASLK